MNNLPILSTSLYNIIKSIKESSNDEICAEIIKVHEINDEIRSQYRWSRYPEIYENVMNTYVTDEVRMISYRMNDDLVVSFLPKDKEPEYNSNGDWGRKNRQTGKPAKIFQKLLVKKFSQRDWEVFANRFKSEVCCSNLEVVSGDDIAYWYNGERYYNNDGTLGSSCMRYDYCEDYFGIYRDNAKMLISLKDGLLTGRAILWEVDGITIMDRVYTSFDYLTDCFINYAKDHKWWIRTSQSYLSTEEDQYWLTPDDDYSQERYRRFVIPLKKTYSHFPYLDSFRYYNGSDMITNVYNYFDPQFTLDDTEGGYNECEETMCCDRCGATYIMYNGEVPDELGWSDYDEMYLCENCRWYSTGLEDYISNRHESVEVLSYKDDILYYPDEYVDNNLVDGKPDEYNKKNGFFVEIDGKVYADDYERLTFNEEKGKWELKDSI